MDADRLGVLVHEIRSPVAALVAIADAVARSDLPPQARFRLVLLGIAAGRDLERLLADPELFSVRLEEVDAGALVRAVAFRYGLEQRTSGADLPVRLRADPARLRQALANLIENGLRHGDAVWIDVRVVDGEVAIEVSDDGPGVDPSLDVFARGVSGAGSAGLGLFVARAIVAAHGGSVELLPPRRGGATFRLSLPSFSGGD